MSGEHSYGSGLAVQSKGCPKGDVAMATMTSMGAVKEGDITMATVAYIKGLSERVMLPWQQ